MNPPPERLRSWILGQDEILDRLSRVHARDRLAQAYLFLGPRGCGKTRLALAFAQELLCPRPDAPCGLCPACHKVARLTHPDLHLLLPAAREEAINPEAMGRLLEAYASDRYDLGGKGQGAGIGIDRIRAVKEEAAMACVEGDRRVVVISGAEKMTEQAAQSALKLVEEPPPQTTLILAATEVSDLLPTLVSRCSRIRLRLLSRDVLIRLLEEELGVSAADAPLLAALSAGSLGRALEMKDSGLRDLRDRVLACFDVEGGRLEPREIERRVRTLERSWSADTARRAVELLLIWYRDLLQAGCGIEGAAANLDLASEAARIGSRLRPDELSRRMRIVEEMGAAVDQNVNPVLALHAALARLGTGAGSEDLLVRM